MIFKTLNNNKPHSSWGGWAGFLASCEVRDTIKTLDGPVTYYGKTNCNYIVLPNGYVIENYAFHGRNLMCQIRRDGWQNVWAGIQAAYKEYDDLIGKLRKAI